MLSLCISDLFLVCDEKGSDGDKYFQIWVNNKDAGFSLAQLGRFPKGFQSVTFNDVGMSLTPNGVKQPGLLTLTQIVMALWIWYSSPATQFLPQQVLDLIAH